MIYKNYEVVVSSHYGSLTEDEHTIYVKNDKPFWRSQSQFGIVYGKDELTVVQGQIELIDVALDKAFPN